MRKIAQTYIINYLLLDTDKNSSYFRDNHFFRGSSMITRLKAANFTAFTDLEMKFSSGANIFIGENGTGKTHILKAIYAACDVSKSQKNFAEKLNKVFLPSSEQLGRLIKRTNTSNSGFIEVRRKVTNESKFASIRCAFSNHTKLPEKAIISGSTKSWAENPIEAVFIPVKDMMANAPGFRSLYNLRNIHFEEVYADIIDRVFLGALKGPIDSSRRILLDILQKAMDGKVVSKKEEFFLKNSQGELEFTLLAEGIRKLGLLWVLIQNGTLVNGSVLLWDEPETNLNPKLMRVVVEILLQLQRMGVQIFVTTHNYGILKEFDLQSSSEDKIIFHSMYRDSETKEIAHSTAEHLCDISPNSIDEVFNDFVGREIIDEMGGLGK